MSIVSRIIGRFFPLGREGNGSHFNTALQTYTCHQKELPRNVTFISRRHEAESLVKDLDGSLVQTLGLDTENTRKSLVDLVWDHRNGLTHFYCEPLKRQVFSAITIPQTDNSAIGHDELIQLGQHVTDLIYGDGKERSITAFTGTVPQGELTFGDLLSRNKIMPRDPKLETTTKKVIGETIGNAGSVIVISLVGDTEIKVGHLTINKAIVGSTTEHPLIRTLNKAAAAL